MKLKQMLARILRDRSGPSRPPSHAPLHPAPQQERAKITVRSRTGIPDAPEPVVLGLADRRNPESDPAQERAIVRRVWASYRKMKAAQKTAPAPYQPGHKWAPEIRKRRGEYIEALRSRDLVALTKLLRNFYRNSGSFSLLKYASFQQLTQPSSAQERILSSFYQSIRADLETWKEYAEDRDPGQLAVPLVGNPYGCVLDGQLITPAACPHNYYFQRARALLAGDPESVVAEIGAGFGGIAYFLLRSGMNLHYVEFDLPEVLIVAEYFLLTALPEKRFLLFGEDPSNDLSMDVIRQYDGILMPNFQLPRLPDVSVDLFINTHSLSEMDYATVEEYMSQITRACKKYFFHENSDWQAEIGYGKTEVTSSEFPIPKNQFTRIYKLDAIWNEPRYREYLYRRI